MKIFHARSFMKDSFSWIESFFSCWGFTSLYKL